MGEWVLGRTLWRCQLCQRRLDSWRISQPVSALGFPQRLWQLYPSACFPLPAAKGCVLKAAAGFGDTEVGGGGSNQPNILVRGLFMARMCEAGSPHRKGRQHQAVGCANSSAPSPRVGCYPAAIVRGLGTVR